MGEGWGLSGKKCPLNIIFYFHTYLLTLREKEKKEGMNASMIFDLGGRGPGCTPGLPTYASLPFPVRNIFENPTWPWNKSKEQEHIFLKKCNCFPIFTHGVNEVYCIRLEWLKVSKSLLNLEYLCSSHSVYPPFFTSWSHISKVLSHRWLYPVLTPPPSLKSSQKVLALKLQILVRKWHKDVIKRFICGASI